MIHVGFLIDFAERFVYLFGWMIISIAYLIGCDGNQQSMHWHSGNGNGFRCGSV